MRLLEAVHARVRLRQLSPRTEQTYAGWLKRFVRYHGCRHPREMGDREIGHCLTSLAVDANVSASTQNQALAALRFLYREVLGIPVAVGDETVRAKRGHRLPRGDDA